MKENEIIERLEALVKNGFPFCADALNLINHLKELDKKNENIIRLADKTIKSQSAEIEKKDIEIDILIRKKEALKDEVERLKAEAECADGYADALVERTKSEAIKEFAERLKEEVAHIPAWGRVAEKKIDNLVKEMVGNQNE